MFKLKKNFFLFNRKDQNVTLPPFEKYATGIFFLDKQSHTESEEKFRKLAEEMGFLLLAWRTVPTDSSTIGQVARNSEPFMRQVFVGIKEDVPEEKIDTRIFMLRKRASHTIPAPGKRFYICSLSSKIIVYKGQFTSDQLWTYYSDLNNPMFETYLALVHTRFSTNTFPSWERAHPLRYVLYL